MSKFNALLNLRLKSKNTQKPKMSALAERSNRGGLSSFSGVFRVAPLNDEEKETLNDLLENFRLNDSYDISEDLNALATITSEVKAITNQAIILHGERIKKAQIVLKKYKDGAFTSWLITIYGNRQTPYNFLQYYEFYLSLPEELKIKMDSMPRQAVYTLASRSGDQDKKQEIVEKYRGEKKEELLTAIRKIFPLEKTDKRSANTANQVLAALMRLKTLVDLASFKPSKKQLAQIQRLMDVIQNSF